ncbi:MAG: sulfate adenylyltransferase [Desulfobulbaceae bacterium]|nr:sulfate adenylyltransferase [Desulfobulbaceae bacterium]
MNILPALRRRIPNLAGVVIFIFLIVHDCFSDDQFKIDKTNLDWAAAQYCEKSQDSLLTWEKLIRENNSESDFAKLDQVNRFFNRFEFISDYSHWGTRDYWATPLEFIASGGGDCEDFSFAKYFTLKALGISDKKLNLTYVKALQLNQAHMVLTYFASPGAEPLILDNLTDEIEPASTRSDLLPVYSFNATGLWLAKQRGKGKLVGKSSKLERWQSLLERMPKALIR